MAEPQSIYRNISPAFPQGIDRSPMPVYDVDNARMLDFGPEDKKMFPHTNAMMFSLRALGFYTFDPVEHGWYKRTNDRFAITGENSLPAIEIFSDEDGFKYGLRNRGNPKLNQREVANDVDQPLRSLKTYAESFPSIRISTTAIEVVENQGRRFIRLRRKTGEPIIAVKSGGQTHIIQSISLFPEDVEIDELDDHYKPGDCYSGRVYLDVISDEDSLG